MGDVGAPPRAGAPLERIVLGTVQIGTPYGRNRNAPLMSLGSAFSLLDAAWDMGLRAFDTAVAYGEAVDRLSAWLDRRGIRGEAHIVTKVKPAAAGVMRQQVADALRTFDGAASITLLTHGPVEGAAWHEVLEETHARGGTAGQSVYTRGEVADAIGRSGVARVQAPANIFDRAALDARGNSPVPLDLRSAYLQGVLLDPPERADRRAPGAGVLATRVQAAAAAVGESAAVLLAAAVLRISRATDRVVLGADDATQVEAIAHVANAARAAVEAFIALTGQEPDVPPASQVLDPRTWPARSDESSQPVGASA